MVRVLIGGALLLLSLAFPASDAWSGPDAWGAYQESELHSTSFSTYEGRSAELFAGCDENNRLGLPKSYSKDYALATNDVATFERMMNSAKRFGDIREALKAGYLPVTSQGFLDGVGLRLGHPDLLKDGDYQPDRPDMLTYIKQRGEARYRLVGLVFVVGDAVPADRFVPGLSDEPRKESKRGRQEGWKHLNDICLQAEPGRALSIRTRAEMTGRCPGGKLFSQLYSLHAWPLVYNPHGLLHEKNPMVDFLDREQGFGALCANTVPKKKRTAGRR